MNIPINNDSNQNADWIVNFFAKIVLRILVAGAAALVTLAVSVFDMNEQVGILQTQLTSIEKNQDVLRNSVTDNNNASREDLRIARDSLTRHYENHVQLGGSE